MKVLAVYLGDRLDYLLVVSGDGQHKVVERDGNTNKSRSHHVSARDAGAVARSADPYAAAADLFHRARLAQKARRKDRATGGCDEQLVPPLPQHDGVGRVQGPDSR